MRTRLLPAADLITPNLPEAALLLGDDVPEATTPAQMCDQARELVARGTRAVLLKGGHAADGEVADILVTADGEVTEFAHPRIATPNTHGTGCTLSAAITAEAAVLRRANGGKTLAPEDMRQAVERGLDFLARALASAADWQVSLDPAGAHGPVDHQVDIVRR